MENQRKKVRSGYKEMKNPVYSRIICILLAMVIMLAILSSCTKISNGTLKSNFITYYKDVPGVTDEEINAVETLREQKDYFVFGMPVSTEAFIKDNGEVGGFAALFCEWLISLFDIPFNLVNCEFTDIIAALENGELDFAGLVPTVGRKNIYFITDPIAERYMKYFRLSSSNTVADIVSERPIKLGVEEDTARTEIAVSLLEPGTYELIYIKNNDEAYDLLKTGGIDAFVHSNTTEVIFDGYDDIVTEDFYPITSTPFSMAAQNPDFEPIISVVKKALANNGSRFLADLYEEGYEEYRKHKLSMMFSEEEKAYLHSHKTVKIGAQYFNYPISFYNNYEKQWQGIYFDILSEVENLTGLVFELANDEHTEWSVLLKMLEDGEISFTESLIRSKEREDRFIWPDTSIVQCNYAFLSKTEYPNVRIADIENIRVGVSKNSIYSEMVKEWFPEHKYVSEYDTTDNAIAALGRGEVDLVMANRHKLLALTNYYEIYNYKINYEFIDQMQNTKFGFNKNEAVLCSIIDKSLAIIDIKGISQQWMTKTYDYASKLAQARRPWLIGISVLAFGVIILLSLLILRIRSERRRLKSMMRERTAELEENMQNICANDIQKNKLQVLLRTVNDAAIVLLVAQEDTFEESLKKGMELMGCSLSVDRVQIWQNEMIEGELYFVHKYQWLSENGMIKAVVPIGLKFPYSDRPEWETKFLKGEYINGPISKQARDDQDFFKDYEIESIVIIPLFLQNRFWGFFSSDDCCTERTFTEDEIDILRSASLMMASAINRTEQSAAIREANDRAKLMLNATPLACSLWDKNFMNIECNEDAVRLFNLKSKREYLERFFELTPEYQSNGQRSYDMIIQYITNAFEEGRYIGELMRQLPDGTLLPTEMTLVRVAYEDDYAVASYSRDLREQKRLQAELETAFKEAQDANLAKNAFLANMSHEMRTPLNGIVGLSELILNNEKLEVELEEKLEKIHTSGMTLLSIVNDILDISKVKSGKFDISPVEYDIPSLINDIVTLNILRVREKPIIFKLSLDETLHGAYYGDDLRIKQIFNNLLSNAFKYTISGTVEWHIWDEKDGDNLWLASTVRDTGIGIKPEDMPKLFLDYTQVDAKINRRVEGTGLGLAITKRLLEIMGGTITVESEYGKGTTFSIRLPQKFVSDKLIGRKVAENLMNFNYTAAKRTKNARLVYINMSYAHVLVVDDVATNLDVVKGMMKPYGLQIDCVTSARQAIDAIRAEKTRYDAVFMDHMMPGMDGIEATRIIREEIGTDYARNVSIIALTANAIVGNEEMFLQKGFQAFISKPIDIMKLDSVLRQWVRDKDLEEELPDIYKTDNSAQLPDSIKELSVKNINVDDLDINSGLNRFGGEDIYMDVLRSYSVNTRPLVSALKEYLQADNMHDYAVTVHGIKGSSYNICANEIGNDAEKLETDANYGNIEAVKAGHNAFEIKTVALLDNIDRILASVVTAAEKPVAESPDPELLDELRRACGNYEMGKIKKLMKQLESFTYRSGEKMVAWLREQVDDVNFEEIYSGKWT